MSGNAITRRGFLAGTAGVIGAAGLAGYMSFDAWERAYADDSDTHGTVSTVHSTCNGCSNKCGFTAYVVDGKLRKLIGDERHPMAKGKLCARGYAYAEIAYSKDRLTDPLKKNDKGQFEAISWEQALSEIGAKVQQIVSSDGPGALAMVQDPRPSGSYYAKRFMSALGSPNVYTHGAACYESRESGIKQVIGANSWTSDVANAQMTIFIGRSYADGLRPSALMAMEKAHEAGSHIVLVDPRFTNSQKFADEWVPITPGTDLALVLALCQVVTTEDLYDADYVAANSVGFDEFRESIAQYTPRWAAEKTGIDETTIKRLAHQMAQAAPACSIESGWRGPSGCQYKNSGELARAVACFNALLGVYNQKGGALLYPSVSAGKLDEGKFPSPPKPQVAQVGSDEFPLAVDGSALAAVKAASEGSVKGFFFYNSNMVGGYSNPSYLAQVVSGCDLSVCVDVQMSETAAACQYVLPDTSYLERSELPAFAGGAVPSVSMRTQVIDVVHPNTKPVDEIFTELAQACGVGQYFDFTMDELAAAQLASVGVDVDAARQMGTVYFNDKAFSYGSTPNWKTPTGKIQFASDACKKAGYEAVPSWIEPDVMPMGNELRLIEAKQPIHSHTMTANNETLMGITKKYDLTRAWINRSFAENLGIADGDTIEVSNEKYTGKIGVHVTDRIVPGALYLPSAYGVTVEDQHTAYGVGLRPADFLAFKLEPGYGSAMAHEVCVTVKKVNA